MFKSSSYSKEPSNSFNFSKFKSSSINSNKLKGGLESILKSFDQFFLTNTNVSKFSTCKWHLLKLVNIFVKEKILSVSIGDTTIHRIRPIKKSTLGKNGFMFCPPLKRALNFLGIHLVTSKNQYFPSDKFCAWFTWDGNLFKNIQIKICIYCLICICNFRFLGLGV